MGGLLLQRQLISHVALNQCSLQGCCCCLKIYSLACCSVIGGKMRNTETSCSKFNELCEESAVNLLLMLDVYW